MYAWIWHRLPGPTPARVLLALVLVVAVVAILFLAVFPWVEGLLPVNDVTVGTGAVAHSLR